MATLKANGNEVYKVVSSGTSGLAVDTTVNSNGVTVNSPFANLKMTRQSDVEPETWYFNSSLPTSGGDKSFTCNFTSNSLSFTGISYTIIDMGGPVQCTLTYNGSSSVTPYDYNDWVFGYEAYRTIILESPATGDLLTWLTANATKQ